MTFLSTKRSQTHRLTVAAAVFAMTTCFLNVASASGCDLTSPLPRASLYGKDPSLVGLSVEELTKRAEAGSPEAQNNLGVVHGTGQGVPKDAEESARWYRRAAEAGNPSAQANLAFMYFKGEGVAKDLPLALQWAEKSAAQGHFHGQLFAGYMYATGTGAEKDGKAAEACYLLAAKQGNLDAQRTLARMCEVGDGVPKDGEKVILWLHRVRDAMASGRTWREE